MMRAPPALTSGTYPAEPQCDRISHPNAADLPPHRFQSRIRKGLEAQIRLLSRFPKEMRDGEAAMHWGGPSAF
jgi:hypothetical protein